MVVNKEQWSSGSSRILRRDSVTGTGQAREGLTRDVRLGRKSPEVQLELCHDYLTGSMRIEDLTRIHD